MEEDSNIRWIIGLDILRLHNIDMMLKLFLSTQGNTYVCVILCMQDTQIYIYCIMTEKILLIKRLEGNI